LTLDNFKDWFEQWGREHSMDYPETHDSAWYARRRKLLAQQTLLIRRLQQESAGQLVLPIFGDNSAKKLTQNEAQALTLKGIHLADAPQRKA